MLYTIGSRVKLKSTGDTGSISAILGEDLVQVKLDDGLGHIPVPTDAITYEFEAPDGKSTQGARYVQGKSTAPVEQDPIDLDLGYTIINPWGVQLAFDPVLRIDAQPDRYRVYLINDTGSPLIFHAILRNKQGEAWQRVGTIEGTAYFELGDLKHSELNDQSEVELEVRPKLEGGTGPSHRQVVKIKPKQFFARQKTAPLLNRKVYHYVVFPKIKSVSAPNERKESLANYTKRASQSQPKQRKNLRAYSGTPDPLQLASFPRSIDLHIEKLISEVGKTPRKLYLSTQLHHCRNYLNKANNLGIDRVYLIHGLGEGKLKEAIHRELGRMTSVKSFNNDYHPSYGNGATEVVFN